MFFYRVLQQTEYSRCCRAALLSCLKMFCTPDRTGIWFHQQVWLFSQEPRCPVPPWWMQTPSERINNHKWLVMDQYIWLIRHCVEIEIIVNFIPHTVSFTALSVDFKYMLRKTSIYLIPNVLFHIFKCHYFCWLLKTQYQLNTNYI